MAFTTKTLTFILATAIGSFLVTTHVNAAEVNPLANPTVCPLEKRFISEAFVNVQSLDPTILVDLKYAKKENFMGQRVYDLSCAWLRPKAADMLAKANRILRSRFPNLRILVADALRPRSVQQRMWKLVVNTAKQRYVADPSRGSMHNYGAAVDVTLYDVSTGKPLDMGTPLDYFGPLAQPALEPDYLRSGKLNKTHLANRAILRDAMRDAGWHPLRIEWWHFNAFPREYVRATYTIIE